MTAFVLQETDPQMAHAYLGVHSECGCWTSDAFMSCVDRGVTTEAGNGAALVDVLDGHHSPNDH